MFPATISPTAPAQPNTHDLWYDVNTDIWKRWDGTQWVAAETGIGPVGPPGPPGRSVGVTQSPIEPTPESTTLGDIWIKP